MRLKDITVISMNEKVNVRDSRIKILHVPESDRYTFIIVLLMSWLCHGLFEQPQNNDNYIKITSKH